ncbi:2-oxoacid:acceptor oxidoreductase subunit alpha [Oceanotoga sp. DSM 15011]|jgi:2-oxoglutarate ferredoxin oxidoreductase subunit alpha|uniref:2-oxoglutarate ferredoxin oxidoreductase alpha subunit n=1 Tax=Oceanotoga teriensis TaxID=515440 RepID=A0AA45HJD3_9BACT|nr:MULTISPECIES: 2-oxoacid:acceptor oxidoreductase subunit alpha [Oceanotoga]MDN5341128.1 2-oxoglutarate/2-oxoacid ferredoxin oxidoreductase subunit alpha [Oceanotoga sp.]MDO7976810.1 2-oxoacid:acceptor oxidoreductase subunit alpha [Oceanotoga teriensis]PWJ95886.1 2-oxoglutarate ferredoxin oxidoreductase alpha subunit [Oceanotoga teriensis]UYP00888.1 2-oxoacid:acceptor oxidoreductase subunit alpha [Oceanotoga sp. DSM 15011]
MGKMYFMQGNEAAAKAAIKAGCKFFAGYPITPSTEVAETMARELPKVGGTFIQMEDEIASAAAIIGASLAGTKSMTATSGPGFSLMQEALGYGIMTETPCVFVDVMRGGPSTGMPTKPAQGDIMQVRWGTHGDHQIIVLYPSTVEEVFKYTTVAFNYAEKYRTPVILLMDEVLGHMRESVYLEYEDEYPENIERKKEEELSDDDLFHPFDVTEGVGVQPLVEMGKTRFHVSGLVHDETGFPVRNPDLSEKMIQHLDTKIRLYTEDISIYDEYMLHDAEIVVVAYGSTARSALRAVKMARADKIPVGLFKPITIWPIPTSRFKRIFKNAQAIIVPELNLGQYVHELSKLNKINRHIESLTKTNGELFTPEEILKSIVKTWIQITEM